MTLFIGDEKAESGMTHAIYESIEAELSESLKTALGDEQWEAVRVELEDAWKRLSYSLAKSIVTYMRRDQAPEQEPELEYGETFSSSQEDAEYWQWLSGFVGVFEDWQPVFLDGRRLKRALMQFLADRPVPTKIRGIIE